jgi:hypothetical protein
MERRAHGVVNGRGQRRPRGELEGSGFPRARLVARLRRPEVLAEALARGFFQRVNLGQS